MALATEQTTAEDQAAVGLRVGVRELTLAAQPLGAAVAAAAQASTRAILQRLAVRVAQATTGVLMPQVAAAPLVPRVLRAQQVQRHP